MIIIIQSVVSRSNLLYFVAGEFIIFLIKPMSRHTRDVLYFWNLAVCNIAIPVYSVDANMRKRANASKMYEIECSN